MRKLGQELGVEAMALYHHFANKDELIDGDRRPRLRRDRPAVAGADWKIADAPAGDLGPRRAGSPPLGDRADGVADEPRSGEPAPPRRGDRQPSRGGLRHGAAAHAYSLLDSYIYGFALTKMNLPFDDTTDIAEMAESMLEPFPPGEYPNLAAFITEHAMQPGYDFADEFESAST